MTESGTFPSLALHCSVKDWACAILGEGPLAARRLRALIGSGAKVTLYAPNPEPALYRAVEDTQSHIQRQWPSAKTLQRFDWILIGHRDQRLHRLGIEARAQKKHEKRILLSLFGDQKQSDIRWGAHLRHGAITFSVFSDGRAPGYTAHIRDTLASLIEYHGQEAERFAHMRKLLARDHTDMSQQERAQTLKAWIHAQQKHRLGNEQHSSNAAIARQIKEVEIRSTKPTRDTSFVKSVLFVGAGPGDPELLTIQAVKALQSADLILVDALVPDAVYTPWVKTGAVIQNVGKRAAGQRIAQTEIHRWMLEGARAGLQVVRLKGGDPGLFGRLAEEIEALNRHEVPYRLVPGVSSALAAPLLALGGTTARDVAQKVCIMTGHAAAETPEPQLPPYASDQTVILLMGIARRRNLATQLLRMGYPAKTPVALLSHMSQETQSIEGLSLGELCSHHTPVPTPGIIVVGNMAQYACAREQQELVSSIVDPSPISMPS